MKVLRSIFAAGTLLAGMACAPAPTGPRCPPPTDPSMTANVIINGIVVGTVPLKCVDGAE